jgi:hypothetical protein
VLIMLAKITVETILGLAVALNLVGLSVAAYVFMKRK